MRQPLRDIDEVLRQAESCRPAYETERYAERKPAPIQALEPIVERKVMQAAYRQAARIREERDGLVPGSTWVQLAMADIEAGLGGDRESRRIIADRMDGKPAQEINGGIDIKHTLHAETLRATADWAQSIVASYPVGADTESMPDGFVLPASLRPEQD